MIKKKAYKIFGVPGAGKTTKCVEFIKRFLDEGYKLEDICFTTFTKSGIQSVKEKLLEYNNSITFKDSYFQTLNSLTWSVSGLTRKSIMFPKDIDAYMVTRFLTVESTMHEKSEKHFFLAVYDYLIGEYLKDISELEEIHIRIALRNFMGQYRLTSRHSLQFYYDEFMAFINYKNNVDKYLFADSLLKVYQEKLNVPCKILIVDEAQDLTLLQYKIIKHWAKEFDRDYFIIAGDSDQSVHYWNGARPEIFLVFKTEKMEEIILNESYRLPDNISKLGNTILNTIIERKEKDIFTNNENSELRRINIPIDSPSAQFYKTLKEKLKLGKVFILFRTNKLKRWFAKYLLNNYDIAFGDISEDEWIFYNVEFVKLCNALNSIASGKIIEKYEAKTLFRHMGEKHFEEKADSKIKNSEGFKINDFLELTKEHKVPKYYDKNQKENFYKEVKESIIQRSLFKNKRFDDIQIKKKLRNIQHKIPLVLHKQAYKVPFKLLLGTYHASKGLEAETVFINLGTSNNFEDIDDNEKRCLYTAVTRTKGDLIILDIPKSSNDNLHNYYHIIFNRYLKNMVTVNETR